MNTAIFSMAEAKFAMGDFNQMVLNRTGKAQLKAKAKKDNVAGFPPIPVCYRPNVSDSISIGTVFLLRDSHYCPGRKLVM